MADILKPDLCVIGAGALGIKLAMDARARGADVVLIDRGDEPGDGAQQRLHQLALASSAARAHAIRTAPKLGLEAIEPKPNFKAIAEHADTIAQDMVPRDAHERLAALGIKVLVGTPNFIDRNAVSIDASILRAGRFALATGSRPTIPPLPGLDQVSFFTPDEILANSRKLTHLVVIGGNAAAFELAQAYRRLGSVVTVVPQGEILPGFDREAVAILLRALAEEGLDVLEGAAVTAILPRNQGTGIAVRRADGSDDALDVSHILIAMGRVPDLDAALIEKARIKLDPIRPGHLLLTPGGETSNGRISAIGGAAGIDDPAIARAQAAIVLDRVLGTGRSRLDWLHLVRHVATAPTLAQVGRLEGDKPLRTGETVLRANLAETEAARAQAQSAGLLKVLIGEKGNVLGGVMLGDGALETLALLALALERGLKMADLGGLLLPASASAAALVELGRQANQKQPPRTLQKQLAGLRRLIP